MIDNNSKQAKELENMILGLSTVFDLNDKLNFYIKIKKYISENFVPLELPVIKKNAGIERLKQDCLEAQKKYDECWEDQPFDENDEKFTCTRCGGMLYIEQGGDIVDCTSCGATGVQKPERIFNAQKFGEWIETNPFFYFDENEEDYKDDGNESIFSL